MLMKTTLLVSTKISQTRVKVNENIEFDVVIDNKNYKEFCGMPFMKFNILNRKGDFKIVEITNDCNTSLGVANKDGEITTFTYDETYSLVTFNFYIEAEVEFKKIELHSKILNFCLLIPAQQMQKLKIFEYYEDSEILPQYGNLIVKYCVRKNQEGWVEVVVGLPGDNLTSYSEKNQYKHICPDSEDCKIKLFLTSIAPNKISPTSEMQQLPESQENPETMPSPPPKTEAFSNLSLYEILKETKYSDVILISSDNTEIPSHRSVLAKHSKILEKIFDESTEIPVKINMETFGADTISAALDFCYGNQNAITGKEIEVFEFSIKYDIAALKEACCKEFEQNVCVENVVEIVQIAYKHNFEELKQKCKKILAEENKGKFDSSKLDALPKNILIEAFCL